MNQTATSSQFVHLLSVGKFGQAVARHLKTLRDDVLEKSALDNAAELLDLFPIPRANVIVASRPVPQLCKLLDEFSHQHERSFISLVLDSNALVLGPVVIPGRGSCWTCWSRRSMQHTQWPGVQKALMAHYSSLSKDGPRGYLEPLALLAAARISETLDDVDSGVVSPGSVWRVDILTREVTTSTAVGVHGCPRCGLQRPEETRSIAALQEQLSYLRTKGASGGQ